jgi:hypothetical protein
MVPREPVPQPHDQDAEQFFNGVEAIECRELSSPPQRAFTISNGATDKPGETMLPRKPVRTAWKGTGQ